MKLFSFIFAFLLLLISYLVLPVSRARAVTDPLAVPNNKYGIHIITATRDEASEAARLVNNNGDWGYITVLAESGDRNEQKWQEFFNELRRRHLIPIVRLATKPTGQGVWERPYENEGEAWADFLDKLNWPVKNRYITIYNEPNHATEWGGTVDPEGFAVILNRTIDKLKAKNQDFFVLNPGFDASAPNKPPDYLDSDEYIKRMNTAVPGIFNKLDGWVSHSYPNPGFTGKPNGAGKNSVRAWEWEMNLLKSLGIEKNLPVFITETGWKHSDGINESSNFPSPETISQYYQEAFRNAWASEKIIAVTPFLLNYQEPPFDQFSFKKIAKNISKKEETERPYHEFFYTLQDAPKNEGKPLQDEKAKFIKLGIEKDGFTNYLEATASGISASLPYGESYNLVLTFKNTGQSIWGDNNEVFLNVFGSGEAFAKTRFDVPTDVRVEPQGEITFKIPVSPLKGGVYKTTFNIFSGGKGMLEKDYPFEVEVKAPVFLNITASLKWKDSFEGDYILGILGQLRYALSSTRAKIVLNNNGKSETIETKYLLPDQEYTFVLERPFYKPKAINQMILPGANHLDFGELQPDIRSAILRPVELWRLLPWSN